MPKPFALLLILAVLAPPAAAFDVGDPWFRGPEEGPANRIEFVYESMSRSLRTQLDRPLLGTPSTGPTMIGPQPAGESGRDKGDIFLVRWVHQPVEMVSTQLDVGFTGGEGDDGTSIIVGGAVRFLLKESGPFQLSTQFDGHYIPNVEQGGSGVSIVRGPYTYTGDYRVHEFGVAVLGSMTAEVNDQVRIMAYGGPRISTYRGRMESHADYPDTGDRIWLTGVTKQASVFGVVLGSRIDWGAHWSARVEARLIEEQSLSASLMASF
ncbi:hypothetical protein MalM25_37050 [Planctomycetes bacterium MalM25]|nr:hypothetical protein MalM25_37050 [Planctomycetes bacterium MalM25]